MAKQNKKWVNAASAILFILVFLCCALCFSLQIGAGLKVSASSSMTSADLNHTNVNFVNYNMETKEKTFERFDPSNYQQRTKTASTNSTSSSTITVSDEATAQTNSMDFNYEIQTIDEENEIYYTEGFTPSQSTDIYTQPGDETQIIIGEDDRTRVTDTKNGKYLMTGFVRSTYKNVYNNVTGKFDTRRFRGTAFMEGPNLVVTAGHCVYADVTTTDSDGDTTYEDKTDNPRFPDSIEFYFGAYDSSDIAQGENYQYYAKALVVNIEYAYFLSPSFDQDWAAVELDRDIGYSTGWNGKISNWYEEGAEITTFGYPDDKAGYSMWESSGILTAKEQYVYHSDIDTWPGQSGSAINMVSSSGSPYVCGIITYQHTNIDNSDLNYNGGTIINSLIFHYLNSFVTRHSETHTYDYLELSVKEKSGSSWKIQVHNTSSMQLTLKYNEKMCFKNDAKNLTNLADISKATIAPYGYYEATISTNVFATSITCYYTDNGYNVITYADGLNANGSLTQYYNLIAA
jgi:V8-like Glu-specific endopeptidase